MTEANVTQTEADLVADLLVALPRPLVRGRPWVAATEVGVGKRIADVVVAAWERLDGSARVLSVHESVLVASLLHTGPQTLGALAQLGDELCERARSAAEALLEAGLLERRRGNRLWLSHSWHQTRPVRVVAIEAKLRDWRGALEQAERYFQFADETYVALPWSVAARVRRSPADINEFIRRGVGLLAVEGSLVRRYAVSRRTRKVTWQREFVGSRLLAERENGRG